MKITITISESNGYDAEYSTDLAPYMVNQKQIEMLFEIMRAERLGRGERELPDSAYASLLAGVLSLGLNLALRDYSEQSVREYRHRVKVAAMGRVR